jgi:putative transposase
MKLIAQVKLTPTPEQAAMIRATFERTNAACEFVSQQAWASKTFRRFDLHHLCYRAIRDQYGLSAQVAVRVIAKVADAYVLDKNTPRTFNPTGAIAYDDRILTWRMSDSTVSIWTLNGRVRAPFVCGATQRALLGTRQGESDLIYRKGKFYLLATCEVSEAPLIETDQVLGIDLGVKNIAVDSDGAIYSSSQVNNVRYRHRRLRAKLQSKGTKSARRRLRKLSGKERRFARDVNHQLSKSIVAKARDTRRAIALEDLTGIRLRVTVRRAQRATLHSWSFSQLRTFVTYKAQRAGVPVFLVDPRNTSRTCPACGSVDKRNRKTQETFSCIECGCAGHADYIAAVNISRRAAVNPPNVSTVVSPNDDCVRDKPLALAGCS